MPVQICSSFDVILSSYLLVLRSPGCPHKRDFSRLSNVPACQESECEMAGKVPDLGGDRLSVPVRGIFLSCNTDVDDVRPYTHTPMKATVYYIRCDSGCASGGDVRPKLCFGLIPKHIMMSEHKRVQARAWRAGVTQPSEWAFVSRRIVRSGYSLLTCSHLLSLDLLMVTRRAGLWRS